MRRGDWHGGRRRRTRGLWRRAPARGSVLLRVPAQDLHAVGTKGAFLTTAVTPRTNVGMAATNGDRAHIDPPARYGSLGVGVLDSYL